MGLPVPELMAGLGHTYSCAPSVSGLGWAGSHTP